ncbi:MAG: TRAP transporter large permease subunit, partial [Rhodospirillaceae bacterium]|nr:TRAP transporter large permease subunit [Rhodospirillaceae bacterium]
MAEAAAQRPTAEELVSSVDTGGRAPRGWQRNLIPAIAFIWALFQLYIASAVPFTLQEWTGLPFVVPNTEARMIHLAFGLLLAAFAFPLLKRGPRDHIPWYDWLLAAVGIASCLYMIAYRNELAERAGVPTDTDLVVASCGMVVLAIAVYRALGLPLVAVASVFVLYVFGGDADWLPDAVQWKGASFGKAMWHFWMQTEGVFGVALGVSASLIFLFVLFGAILEKAGAGNFFIKIAFALLGHLRGG